MNLSEHSWKSSIGPYDFYGFKVLVHRNVVVGKVLVLSNVVGALVWLYRNIMGAVV